MELSIDDFILTEGIETLYGGQKAVIEAVAKDPEILTQQTQMSVAQITEEFTEAADDMGSVVFPELLGLPLGQFNKVFLPGAYMNEPFQRFHQDYATNPHIEQTPSTNLNIKPRYKTATLRTSESIVRSKAFPQSLINTGHINDLTKRNLFLKHLPELTEKRLVHLVNHKRAELSINSNRGWWHSRAQLYGHFGVADNALYTFHPGEDQ